MKLNLFNRNHPELPVYPVENPNASYKDNDDGTIVENVDELASKVIGHRIVSAEKKEVKLNNYWGNQKDALVLTLDDGTQVALADTDDCCAYTQLNDFLLHPESVDHMILGVGTTDEYTTWHIYADFGDIMALDVSWSCGNPFYYGYGFSIEVLEVV